MGDGHLEQVRAAEFATVERYFRKGAVVVELGGGNGYQASLIAARGCAVLSYDVDPSILWEHRHLPVMPYDGVRLPLADASVDVVFSSNVLEHVPNLAPLFAEMRRVLKPRGLAIHILPSASWRLWTSLSHYVYLALRLSGVRYTVPGIAVASSVGEKIRKMGWLYVLRRALVPRPHGEYPSALHELHYFRRARWLGMFAEHLGFEVVEARGSGLFYEGYGLLRGLSLDTLGKLARVLGSATHVFVLRKASIP